MPEIGRSQATILGTLKKPSEAEQKSGSLESLEVTQAEISHSGRRKRCDAVFAKGKLERFSIVRGKLRVEHRHPETGYSSGNPPVIFAKGVW